jgi:chemotaxis family two-component system sensor kinase Cph1
MDDKSTGPVADPLAGLNACDREPIHIPGSIQPHGLLLVANAGLVTIGGAGAIDAMLTADWVGQPLDRLLGQDVAGKLAAAQAASASQSVPLDPVRGTDELFDAVAHRTGDLVVVELEPAAGRRASAAQVLVGLEMASRSFERATGLGDLCARAAVEFRRLTGFDRVMVYRFLDDGAGVVLAEDRDPDLSSFLNHHFPASDIPKQARALYVRNRVRVIPDVGYEPAMLWSASTDLATLDMSDLALRSVSPIHIQYLKNMGVGASASVSIVRDGLLWGLIACHNQAPRTLPYDVRLACDALAGGLARQIHALEETERFRERISLRSLEDSIAARLRTDISLAEFFAGAGGEMCALMSADGFAAVQGADLYAAGHRPQDSEVRLVADWVIGRPGPQPFSTHHLAEELPAAEAFADRAAGLVAATMSTEPPTVLLWFRAEQVEVVNWAGNPHKAVPADPAALLTPRSSFAAWSEAIRGRSRPWTTLQIEAASRLMKTIFDARQQRRVRDLNQQLTETVTDKERLLLQKDYLLKEVSHRIQNSLQLVSSFLSLQARSVDDGVLSGHLNEAQRRLGAVALVHRRLYSDDRIDTVDLSRYLSELCAEIEASMDEKWGEQISQRLSPIKVSADKAVNIGLVLTELLINANKYAYGGAPGPVAITLEQHLNSFRLTVADHGSGRTQAREGFGTRMMMAIIQGLKGQMEEIDNDPGLRFVVTAPLV